MKFKFIFLALLIVSASAFSQSNNISVVYGFSNTNVDIHGAIGDFGFNTKTGLALGLLYTKKITPYFSLQTGLFYQDDKAEENSILPGRGNINDDGDLKIVSVPIIAKFTFFKYLYADAGLSIDKEINYTGNYLTVDQSGIGIEAGIGGQYTFRRITLFINPYIKNYGLAHFNSKEDFNLFESGFKFGVGYNF